VLPKRFSWLCFAALFLFSIESDAAPPFRSFGFLRGGELSEAFAISADGSIAAGFAEKRLPDRSFDNFAFHWTPRSRLKSIGTLGGSYSEASGISADGSVIVGGAQNAAGIQRAFRWNTAGMLDLSTNANEASFALGVSPDGNVVVGWVTDDLGQEQPFRWSAGTGMQNLGTFGGLRGFAHDANEDGTVVVGSARNAAQTLRAFRWTAETGLVDLGDLGGGSSEAYAITPDSAVIVGQSSAPPAGDPFIATTHAFRWTPTNGMEDLGLLPGGQISRAFDVSADGTHIVGSADNSNSVRVAVLWTAETGLFDLNVAFRKFIPRGWSLDAAHAISADGRYIVGSASNRRRDPVAFRLDIRVPSSGSN
jgi:probable HAF family extracellular repeat protein